jgi:hypothetical protein
MFQYFQSLARSMQNTPKFLRANLSNINWIIALPLGIVSLFFLWIGFRRGVRFFDHENNSSKKEKLRDVFLSTFDIVTVGFCVLLAVSPTNLWLVMIPIGSALFVFTIPVSLLGSYYQLYVVTGYMPKNAGIQVQHSVLNEKANGKIVWYEFTPFIFVIGWLIYFLFNIAILAIG